MLKPGETAQSAYLARHPDASRRASLDRIFGLSQPCSRSRARLRHATSGCTEPVVLREEAGLRLILDLLCYIGKIFYCSAISGLGNPVNLGNASQGGGGSLSLQPGAGSPGIVVTPSSPFGNWITARPGVEFAPPIPCHAPGMMTSSPTAGYVPGSPILDLFRPGVLERSQSLVRDSLAIVYTQYYASPKIARGHILAEYWF